MIKIIFCFLLFFEVVYAQEKPNIVVILCDDLGYGDLQCYGHPHIKTPNLDNMAKEGIRFTDFYSTAPVCSSSRVGLMTGRSPNRAGVYDWIPPGGKRKKADLRDQVHMRINEVTIPQLLKKAGYATALSGKWHCNSKFNSKDQPQPGEAGFDHWFATHNNASPSHANPKNFIRNGKTVGPLKGYSCQLVADEAIGWMTKHVETNEKQPFFLYMAFHEPHEPIASPVEIVDTYKGVAKNIKQATYFANVDNIDRAVGRFLAAFKKLSIDDDTLVIFTSDNGPETLNRYGKGSSHSYGSPKPLKGMKLWTTEAGFRVAGIMRWPGRIKSGQTISHPVSALDFMPTFCNLASTKIPASLELDGVDFTPVLENKALVRKKPLTWAYYNATNEHRVAMRDGDWKILARLDHKKFQNLHKGNEASVKAAKLVDFKIFKISEDLSESVDLSAKYPEKLAELTKKLKMSYLELLNGSHIWGK